MVVDVCSGKDGQRRLVEAIEIVVKDYDSVIKGISRLIFSLEYYWQGDIISRVHADKESAIGKAEDDLNRWWIRLSTTQEETHPQMDRRKRGLGLSAEQQKPT